MEKGFNPHNGIIHSKVEEGCTTKRLEHYSNCNPMGDGILVMLKKFFRLYFFLSFNDSFISLNY